MLFNDPEVRTIRDAFLAIEKRGEYPSYAPIEGAFHLMSGFEKTEYITQDGDALRWVHKTLSRFEDMRIIIQQIIEECVANHWHENRLDVEYELRVRLTDEYLLFDERRQQLTDTYFDGARSSLYALMRPTAGDWHWIDTASIFRHAHNDSRDAMLEPALKRYNARYDNTLYQFTLATLGIEGTRYETLTANALTDAALYFCGAPYVDARKIYRILEMLGISRRPVQTYLSRFSS